MPKPKQPKRDRLTGLTESQIASVFGEHKDLRHVWQRISRAGDNNETNVLNEIADEAKADHDTIIVALGSRCATERNHGDPSPVNRYLPQIALGFVVVLAAILVFQAITILKPFGLIPKRGAYLVVTTGRIEAGSSIHAEDLTYVRLDDGKSYFRDMKEVTGLLASRDILKGRPLCFEDVERPQVVASSDIGTDMTLVGSDVNLKATTFDPDAFTSTTILIGRKLLKPVSKGSLILPSVLTPTK